MSITRQIICEAVEPRHIIGTKETVHTDQGEGPEVESTEHDEVYVRFYDVPQPETPHYQPGPYMLILSPNDAAGYKVGETYTLTIA